MKSIMPLSYDRVCWQDRRSSDRDHHDTPHSYSSHLQRFNIKSDTDSQTMHIMSGKCPYYKNDNQRTETMGDNQLKKKFQKD